MNWSSTSKKRKEFESFCRELLENIGATLMGSKPVELRTVGLQKRDSYKYWEECKKIILNYEEIEIIELEENDNKVKVLFYHSFALDKQLNKKTNLMFLKRVGYPEEYELFKYINYLIMRLQKEDFPHEIGVFFGYPLKDVLGFMGNVDLPLVEQGEWKIYGKKSISLFKQKEFELARQIVREKLDKVDNVKEFYKILDKD